MSAIRLLDLGEVPAVRSQTVYHAVAEAMTDDGPDTVILVAPERPYVCVGFHQDAAREVDLDRCGSLDLPVYRRRVGGGAVYLDGDQVFSQWVLHPGRLPSGLEAQFTRYVDPLVATYRDFGVEAYLRPVNDVHVAGKKIGGTGAAQIGDARVLVGSIMFDFDRRTMADVLKVPSEKMRDKVFESLSEYMTTMADEVGPVDRRAVIERYVAHCAAALGADLVPGSLTPEEEWIAADLDARFEEPAWLHLTGAMRPQGVKIHEGVRVVEGAHKAPGGLIRVVARLRDGVVDDLSLSGDFTIIPAMAVADLERAAAGCPVDPGDLAARFAAVYGEAAVESPGMTPHDLATAVAVASAA